MGTLTSVLTLALITAGGSEGHQAHDPIGHWRPLVSEASTRFGIPKAWIERVIRAESGGLTTLSGKPIRSRAGAIGLMQVMPGTWSAMRASHMLGADPDDPHDNIIAGAGYLRLMYDKFGYPGMFAAYNAGPARYAAYLGRRTRLPAETIAYLAAVTDGRSPVIITSSTPPHTLLFALRRDLAEPRRSPSDQVVNDGLFVIRKRLP